MSGDQGGVSSESGPDTFAQWRTCSSSAECRGVALDAFQGRCVAHLAPKELAGLLAEHPGVIDARGAVLHPELIELMVASVRSDHEGTAHLEAQFEKATFTGRLALEGLRVSGETSFEGAVFEAGASFQDSTFEDEMSFRRAAFSTEANFSGTQFKKRVSFAGAQFTVPASFDRARFCEGASFGGHASFAALASFAEATLGDRTRFDDATFDEKPSFRDATFGRGSSFRKTKFGDKASFEWTTFGDEASFHKAVFAPDARFADATFGDGVSFRNTVFGSMAGFQRTSFGDRTWFNGARFEGRASFARATFNGASGFAEAVFEGPCSFEEVAFAGRVRLERVRFKARASFRLASFERARSFGPLLGESLVTLDQASFLEPVSMQITADRLALVRASFPSGAEIQVRFAHVAVDLASFGGPSVLSGSAPFVDLAEDELPEILLPRDERPCIISMRGANLAGLSLSHADLRRCRFLGAKNLDSLHLEGDVQFLTTPKWRTTRRRFIFEEQEWRAAQPGGASGRWGVVQRAFPIERVPRPRVAAPAETAAIYRSLRKGREDESDAPGAADFYYGEMEMRRHDPTAPRSERVLLWLYWAVSGYGLRGLRSIAALLVTIVGFALLFWWIGFSPRPPFTRALLFSAESTSSLFRVPETASYVLTEVGEALQIALRLLGPLFFALALLSLRGRVRR